MSTPSDPSAPRPVAALAAACAELLDAIYWDVHQGVRDAAGHWLRLLQETPETMPGTAIGLASVFLGTVKESVSEWKRDRHAAAFDAVKAAIRAVPLGPVPETPPMSESEWPEFPTQ